MSDLYAAEDALQTKAYDSVLVRRLFGFLRPYRRQVLGALLLTTLLAASQSVVPYLLGLAVDVCVTGRDSGRLWRIGQLLLGVEALAFVLVFAQQYVLTWVGQQIMVDLRMQLFARLQEQSLAFFGTQPVGRLVTRVMNDVGTIAELFSTGIRPVSRARPFSRL